MKSYDSHIHIGDCKKNSEILENSVYKNKYKLYSSISKNVMFQQDEYVSKLDDFFALPLFFKESNIQECNRFVIDYCNNIGKGIPVLLVDDNKSFNDNYHIAMFKEHFLLNKYEDYKYRSLYYEFLNENSGFLLVHCKDNIRIEYINKLLENYKNIHIIIAHLGRDTYESSNFINFILENFKNNERIFFDISTIHNLDNIKNAIKKVGSKRILYGSDFPFEVNQYYTFLHEKNRLLNFFDDNISENIFEKNFEEIKKKIYVRKRIR